MKGFMKFLGGILLIPYLVIVVVVTVCLLCYNNYNVTEIGNYTLIPLVDGALEPNYKEGDLLVVKKTSNDDIEINDMFFFYDKDVDKNTITINLGRVISSKKVTADESTITMEGNVDFSSEYVIGTSDDCRVYSGLGSVLSILESRWVFLLVIILPILFIFLYEIYAIVLEVKKSLKEN